jgi:hypothetical protein
LLKCQHNNREELAATLPLIMPFRHESTSKDTI